jgi:hypothetical protein
MTLIIADRVKETSTTTGTGALTLAGAMTGFRAFSSVCTSPSDTCYYGIQGVDGDGNPTSEWEVGLGTYSAANTLTRTTVQASSNSNNAVSFSSGTKQVWIDVAAAHVSAFNRGYAKAWCYVQGTGTVTILASYNVSSITDNATGQWTVNFTTAFTDANYSSVLGPSKFDGNPDGNITACVGSTDTSHHSTTSLRVGAYYSAAARDIYFNVACFR